MRIITKRDVIRGMRSRWRDQYGQRRDDEVVGVGASRRSVKEIARDLERLNLDTCDAAEIDAIIGNSSWTENRCDECKKDSDVLVHMGDEPDYDMRWLSLCPDCIAAAVALLASELCCDNLKQA